MRFYSEYSWLEAYFDNDSFWLEDVISWDESFELFLSEYNIFFLLTSPFFVNAHFFLDSLVKMSFLDIILFTESDSFQSSREFFDFVIWDLISSFNINFFFHNSIYCTNNQDLIVVIVHNSPELILAFEDFFKTYWLNSSINRVSSALFDVLSDSINFSIDELVKYILMFISFIWIYCLVLSDVRVQSILSFMQTVMIKLESFLFSWSRDTRMQYEAVLIIFFLFFLYGTMMILSFDDDQEEFLEYFEQLLFTGVFYVFFYYVFRVGIHFFSFLEASVSEGRTFSFVLSQFRRDAVNTFSFIMRLCTLMLRFYIYETTDDILDSYYIFVGDFDDDEYFNEMFFSPFSLLFFDIDNNDDRSFFLEDESDWSWDLFTLYFNMLMKLDSLIFWAVEGIARTLLALYIGYLITFEVHTVNRSYTEDLYFNQKVLKKSF